jgi:pyruvate,water dikinase
MSDTARHFVYFFGEGQADAGLDLKQQVGGKGASLAEMTRARLNVPPGFTISAECCDLFYQRNRSWPDGLDPEIRANLARLEQVAGRTFGRGDNPLLVAVRSGAAQSMPGMMDTVLNVGLNPDCVRGMAERTGNRRAAWEAYRHFLVMYGKTVAGLNESVFTELIAAMLHETGKKSEDELDADQMEELCHRFVFEYRQHAGHDMPTDPWAMLCAAINAVFGSWNSERAVTYRRHHKVEGLLGTAVNVQMMCPSEVSGVMFTANPVNPALGQIIIESSYGLGEAIVLGKVTPDRFVLDKSNRQIIERIISKKETVIATLAQDGKGQARKRDEASLTDAQIDELAQLGLRVEEYFKHPCDIEWGLSQGKFYLLQARAVKGAEDAAEREKVRQEEMAALKKQAAPEGTVWSRYNLSEILPEPTPMTWAIVRRFMSGRGGFGQSYRDLGFDPGPEVDEEGVFDLVCGRPYANLSREPFMQSGTDPMVHDFAALKAEPSKAVYPVGQRRSSWANLFRLPGRIMTGMRRSGLLGECSKTLPKRLREELMPAFARETATEMKADLGTLDPPALLERLDLWTKKTLFDFARASLKPTFLIELHMAKLKAGLWLFPVGSKSADEVIAHLMMGVRPDPDADVGRAVQDLGTGQLDRAAFLEKFGHRGGQEMELSAPRWTETPESIGRIAGQDHAAHAPAPEAEDEIRQALKKNETLNAEAEGLRNAIALRETGKHYLLMGYAVMRRILVELDRRFGLNGGIFYLTPDELPQLLKGADLSGPIAQRQRRRKLALSLDAPQVIFSDDLEAIGRPMDLAGAATLRGVPVSAGVSEGPALVLLEATEATPPAEPYILVCPSTDPAWMPLFVHAKGLVMETGGVLSHGAIVAREFGLPAVAGIPDVHRRLKSGQRLRIDGGSGTVAVLE